MTNCPEIVQQATEGSFPWFILLLLLIVAAGAYVWKKGLLGTATEARIKAKLAVIKHDEGVWIDKLKEAIDKRSSTVNPQAPPAPAPVKDKATRLAENAALLAAGSITQADFEASKANILNQ